MLSINSNHFCFIFLLIILLIEMLAPSKIEERSLGRDVKEVKSLFQQLKINETILKQRVKTLKNYETWRKTKLLRINAQQMKRIENESLLSVAFNCGFRNEMNEIFEDVFKKSNKYISTQNSEEWQRSYDRTVEKDGRMNNKKWSFVQYKNTKEQLYKITRNITPESLRNKSKSLSNSLVLNQNKGLDKTPREIAHLRKAMKTLPVMYKKEKLQNSQEKKHLKTTQQISTFKKVNRKYYTERTGTENQEGLEDKRGTNKKKSFFAQKVSQILTTADSLLEQQTKRQSKEEGLSIKSKSPQKKLNKTTYWPQYKHYSISAQDKLKINQIKSNYKQAFEQDFAFEDYILQIVRNMKQDFTQIEEQQKMQIVQAIKNAFELRFKYKINVQRDNYKKNVKSYLKCILDYRNERKREEVKANGIRRFKRQTLMQKIKMLVPQKNEDFQM